MIRFAALDDVLTLTTPAETYDSEHLVCLRTGDT
jgi:hypothetical protein